MNLKKRENSNDNFMFASIVGGDFRVEVPEGTEGAVQRENKNGKIVWELLFAEVGEVFIKSLEIVESEYGKQLKIFLQSKENEKKFFVIQVPLNSGYAYSFLNRVEGVDLEKEVTVKVFAIENKGEDEKVYKTKTLVISQDGKSVEKKWEGDNKEVPKAEPITDKKGKVVIKNGFAQFDYTAKEEFLENYVNDNLQVKLTEFWKAKHFKNKEVGSAEA